MEHKFHKECLDTVENLKLIAGIFSGILGCAITVDFAVTDEVVRDEAADVRGAINMFQGEVVNEWHSEEEKKSDV